MGLRLIVLLGGLLILGWQDANATHIVGGNLTYRCLGNNLYEIRLTVRRDCLNGAPNAQFDDPASIGFFDATTNQLLHFPGVPDGQILIPLNNNDTLNEILVSDCSVIAGDVCVHTTTYVATVALPFHANGYLLAYQRCCRNGTLNNILDPLDTGMTLVAELSAYAQQECNSSPQFRAFPPIYTCVNKELVFDHSAVDPEGDSLVYSLCTPNAGATNSMNQPQPPFPPPFPLVIYRPPYNLSNIMGGIPLTINPQTGELRGTPNTVGQFVVGICVEAYKDGQLTGVTRRDFQFNVRQCRDVPVALFEAPDLTCDTLTINFDNNSLLADEYTWIFDLGDDSVRVNTENPAFTFPEGNFFEVTLIANDADSFCLDTIRQTIGVFDSQIVADFNYTVSECTEEGGVKINVTDISSGFGDFPAESWSWAASACGNFTTSGVQNPSFMFDVPEDQESCTVIIVLVVTSENGCSATVTKTFPIKEIALGFNSDADSICKGETVNLLLGADSTLTYTWNPDNFGIAFEPYPCRPWNPCVYPGISVTYHVTVTDGLCTVTDSIHVGVQQLPTLAFEDTTDCKSLVVTFDNNSINGINYHWDFGDGDTLVTTGATTVTHTYDIPKTYIVTLSSRDGCDVSITDTITANALISTVNDTAVNCFHDSISLNPGFNAALDYLWSGPGFSSNEDNPTVGIDDDTEFFVTITQAGLEGCEIYDSITVVVPDDFTITAPDDIVSCRFDTVIIAAVTTGNTNLDYVWVNAEGEVIGNESSIVFLTGSPDTLKVTATDTLGCSKSDEIIIFKPDPNFSVATCFDTLAYCGIQTITLCAEATVPVTFEWFNADTLLISTDDSVQVTPGVPTCYRVIATESIGCQVDDIVCLTPTFFDLDITNTQNICLGETVEVCVTDNNNQNLSYLWSPTADNTACITVSPEDTTLYTVTVTNNEVGCIDTLSSEVVVSLFEPFDIVITYTPDTIYESLPFQMFVNQSPDFTYVWSTTKGETPAGVWNPIIQSAPAAPVTYTVTVTNEAGCTAVGEVSIPVRSPLCDDSDVFLPTAFTPNGDNMNDELRVYTVYPLVFELHIYNRWGQEVFSTNDQNVGWDGTFNGERLHPDVFGYYMNVTCPNEAKFFKKGNITLLD